MQAKRHSLLIFIIIIFYVNGAEAQTTDDERIGDRLKSGVPLAALLYTFFENKKEFTHSLSADIKGDSEDEGAESRLMLLKSILASEFISLSLKDNISKKRPHGGGNRSFPSEHTSMAFTGAAFMHKRYGLTYGLPAYIGASFVGYSRIQSNSHFTEDVIAGALIGILSSFYFTDTNSKYTLSPQVNDNGTVGISFEFPW